MSNPRVLILRAPGTNCDEETAEAWRLAGARPEVRHLAAIESNDAFAGFEVVTIPGGFSFGDDLGAGRVFAARLGSTLRDALREHHRRGGLILGICNGFQVLVRAGLLPGGDPPAVATLARNASGHYEDRWVRVLPTPGRTPFLAGVEPLELPVAHGEGMFLAADPATLNEVETSNQIVLRYVDASDRPTSEFPANPNGSEAAAAGVCDPTGRIFGLMPHPERHVLPWHHPRWTRLPSRTEGDGLRIFKDAVTALS